MPRAVLLQCSMMLTASIPEEADRCGSRDGDKKKGVLQWFKGWFD